MTVRPAERVREPTVPMPPLVDPADCNKLEIAFEKAGTKMVMGSFVEAV